MEALGSLSLQGWRTDVDKYTESAAVRELQYNRNEKYQMNEINRPESLRTRRVLIFLCLMSGFLVMGIGMHLSVFVPILPVGLLRGAQVAVVAGFLVSALTLHRNVRLRKYWRLAFAYFVASFAVVLSDFMGDWAVIISGQSIETARGFTVLKLAEDATIVSAIIALMLLTRDDPRELLLTKGRLGLGLTIGLPSFLVLTVIGLSSTVSQVDDPGGVRGLLLAYGSISLADGFMEELLFRGLFLRRLARFVGNDWAIVVTALVFTFAHQVFFETPWLLLHVFFFGLLFGWIMQKTGSLLASVLLHAGLNMVTIAGFLERFFGINISG
jgi:membrane protease YdiL (CAAX protease family)